MEETIPLFAPLLSIPLPENRYCPLNLSPQRQRQKTLGSIVAILLELAEREPVLFILEDVHWTDPTTLEFLGLLVEQVPTAALYTLWTYRPHFQPAWHHRSYLTEITVNRLSRNQIEQMAIQVAEGKMLPTEIVQQLVDKTDGVPLFVEEMTKAVLESGLLKEVNGQYEIIGSLAALAIPATLQDSLMARLDRLISAKGIAQLGAVIGRQFSFDLLKAVSQLDESTLQRELGRLVEAELVYQRGLPPQAMYTFKHALVQDIAYASLLRSTRQGYHRRIAEVLEERFPETAEHQPDLLAYHCVEAGLNEQAVGYWQQAGEKAVQRAANAEAVAHLNKGLKVLKTLPDTLQRAQRELTLHMILGQSLINMKGTAAPEVEQTFHRAHVLCQQIGTTANIFRVLNALRSFYLNRAELETARELNAHMLRIAQDLQEPLSLLNAHTVFGHTLVHLGEFTTAQTHLEQGLTVYASQPPRSLPPLSTSGQDLETFCLSWLAIALWLLGYPEQAVQRDNDALALAQAREHLFNLVNTLNYSIHLHRWRGERHIVEERLEASMALSTAYGFAMQAAIGKIARGFVLTEHGDSAGLALMHEGLTAYRATGAVVRQPWHLAELAKAHGKVGQADEE